MSLVTEYDRFDRAAIVERAKQFYETGLPWPQAMRKAYGEALAERELARHDRAEEWRERRR